MFSLFEERDPIQQSIQLFPEWNFVKRSLLSDLSLILENLHTRVVTHLNHHILINLLMAIGFDLNTDLDTYMSIALERAFFVTFSLGITSTSSYGKIHNGIFYGPNVKEILIVDEDDFNYKAHIGSWKYVDPLRVLLCPVSDLSFNIPDGTHTSTIEGIAVISINLKKLLFMYWMWNKEMRDIVKQNADSSLLLGLHHLIQMVILPNMLKTQINVTILNRLMNMFYGAPQDKALKKLQFKIRDVTSRVDSSLSHILKVVEKETYFYSSIMRSIRAITVDSVYDAMLMPDIALTRQINWAYAVARAPIYNFLIELGGQKDIAMNKKNLADAYININLLETEHLLKSILPRDMLIDLELDLDYISNASKKSI